MITFRDAVMSYKPLLQLFADTGIVSDGLLNFSTDTKDWPMEDKVLWSRICISDDSLPSHGVSCKDCQEENKDIAQDSLRWVDLYETKTYGHLCDVYTANYKKDDTKDDTNGQSGVGVRIVKEANGNFIFNVQPEWHDAVEAHLAGRNELENKDLFPPHVKDYVLLADTIEHDYIFSCEM